MVKFNKNEFKWLIILIGFTYYLNYLLSTGKIYLYIHPRMFIYIRFSLFIFIVLILVQIKRIFTIQSARRKIYFSIFLVPLILGIVINPQGLSGEVAANKGVSLMNTSNIKFSTEANQSKATEGALLVVNDSNFTSITDDINYNNPSKFKGRKIRITGFIFRDETTSKTEFVISRLMMVCCAADTEVTGILSDWKNSNTLKDDEWVTITGTMDTINHKVDDKYQLTPVIRVEKVEPVKKPENPYIYPE